MEAAETKLSKLSHRTCDFLQYADYLKVKAEIDALTRDFYLQKKWRGWKFRIFARSEDKMLNRVEEKFGSDYVIFYRDWSRNEQMKGCDLSPVVEMKKAISKKFRVVNVDEYKTSGRRASLWICRSRVCCRQGCRLCLRITWISLLRVRNSRSCCSTAWSETARRPSLYLDILPKHWLQVTGSPTSSRCWGNIE